MTGIDLILLVLFAAMVALIYVTYWAGWCWIWHYVWPSGPEWFVRPTASSFLLASITGLIITLVICSKAIE